MKNGRLTNGDLFRLEQGFREVGSLPGARFAFAVARNLRKVAAYCEDLRAGIKPTTAYSEYDQERIKLARKHAEKDERGKPKVENGEFVVKDLHGFEVAINLLREKHGEAIEEHNAKMKDFATLLEDTSSLTVSDLVKVKFEDLPAAITSHQLSRILEIMDEENAA